MAATNAVGSTILDVFRTLGSSVTQTKVTKDIAKVVKGLIDAGLFTNPEIKDSANKVVGTIDFLEFAESLAYVAKWIDPDYRGSDDPKVEPLRKKIGQISLLFARFFGFLKASNTYGLVTLAQWRKLGEAIPVVKDNLDKVPTLDTLAGIFYLPFGFISLYDNSISGIDGAREERIESAKIAKWAAKTNNELATRTKGVARHNLAQNVNNVNARRAAKIAQHTAQMKIGRAKLLKSGLGGTSTGFKIAAASTAITAALVFGGVTAVLGTLVALGLAGNSISLGKNFFEAYQDKYARLLSQTVAQSRNAAAAA